MNLSLPAGLADDGLKLCFAGLANLHTNAIVGENLQPLDVLVGLATHHGMHAAGVIPDHAANRAAVVSGRIGSKGQVVTLGSVAKRIENHARLNTSQAFLWIHLQDVAHMARE